VEDWTWQSGPNAVEFTAAAPRSGDYVSISYEVADGG